MPFQMHGQMYLMQGPFFYLKKDKYTRYAQLYILGPQLPALLGASSNSDLDRKITSNLDVLSTEVPFVGLYKAIYELFMNAESSESITLFVWTYPSTRITLVFDVKIQNRKPSTSLQYAAKLTPSKLELATELYNNIADDKKWRLKFGRFVEDVLKDFALKCIVEHPSHHLILDLYDANLKGLFTEEEEEILEEGEFSLEQPLSPNHHQILNGLVGKLDFEALEDTISQIEVKGRQSYDKKWLKKALEDTLFLFVENDVLDLKAFEDEDEILYSLWGFLKTLLIGTGGEVHGHSQSNQISSITNSSRSIGGVEPLARKEPCEIPDMSFQYNNCRLGCVEIGAQSGEFETKTLQEAYFKCPVMLQKQAVALCNNNIKQVGIVIDRNNVQAMTLEKSKGSLYVVKRSTRLTFPITINEFSSKIIPILHLMLNTRNIIANDIEAIKKMQREVPVYSLGKRKTRL
ncbi:hypothetical protein EDC96DRAFT_593658 [Choanephora cucurbitarum]|nr:hypothetical protein EDC96DRAFT_593658 [Choanephora cucurbitarum]